MKKVKLTGSFLIGEKFRNEGDVLSLSDVAADRIVKAGHGEIVDDGTAATHDDANPLADAIDPLPPIVQVVNPADALAPKIEDNPGLVDLVKATGKKDEVPQSGTAAGMSPHPTGEPAKAGVGEPVVKTATKKAAPESAANLTGKAE